MKREAGNAIEPVWNGRDCISGAVKSISAAILIAATPLWPARNQRPAPQNHGAEIGLSIIILFI